MGRETREGAAWISPQGELDLATAPTLEEALQATESDADRLPIVLDLRQLSFIDSSGLRVVLAAAKRAEAAGRRLVIIRGANQVDRVLSVTGSDRHLEVVDEPPTFEAA